MPMTDQSTPAPAGNVWFRVASVEDIALMLTWAAAEGWNPGLDDAAIFQAADPEGFFLALEGDQPVAAISVVNHDVANAFLGLYLCRPAWRGRGIGFALWKHALTHAGGRSVGLDGVEAQQANYARSGFVRIGATRRWEGRLDPQSCPGVGLVADADLPRLLELDRTANGVNRPAFLKAWVQSTEHRRTVVLDRPGAFGFATIRRCGSGGKIGPILAPDAGLALELAKAALTELPLDRVAIDLPEANVALADDLVSQGFVNSFTTARMFCGQAPATGPSLQAIATMELG